MEGNVKGLCFLLCEVIYYRIWYLWMYFIFRIESYFCKMVGSDKKLYKSLNEGCVFYEF